MFIICAGLDFGVYLGSEPTTMAGDIPEMYSVEYKIPPIYK